MKKLSKTLLTLSLLPSVLAAQRDPVAGFGAQVQIVDINAAIGMSGSLGIQHLNGEIFVTTRVDPAMGGFHFVTVFDNSGSGIAVRSWPQPGVAQASDWGFRDGATDGDNLFFGSEFGIQIVDENGVAQDGLGLPNIQTANGPRTVPGGLISGNVLLPGQVEVIRALAFDRTGNHGEGSFWTGNFSSSTFEIDIAGDILTTNPNAGEVSYGFAFDPLFPGTQLWINSAPNSGTIAKYDVITGTLTGQVMDQGPGGGFQGGLDIVPAILARGSDASGSDILQLQQGSFSTPFRSDVFLIQRLHLDQAGQGLPPSPFDRDGALEPSLLTSIDNEDNITRSDSASKNYTIDSFELDMFFDISNDPGNGIGNGGSNGLPGVIFVNVGADAAPGLDATSNFLGIRELSHLQPLLTFPAATRTPRSRSVVGTNDPLNLGPGEWRVALNPGNPFAPIGDCIRAQGMFIDLSVNFLPVALTNQARLCRGPDPIILEGTFAEFNGSNSFNADENSGFFSLTNDEFDPSLSIVAATWSINPGNPANSPNTQALFDNFFRWDTNNGGMADIFEGGNSLLGGCTGTYRNGSEISTGLIFVGTPSQNGTPCDLDPLVLQGWIGSDDGPTAFHGFDGDWLTIDFTFSPDIFMNGVVFEWDCDTDGGVGVSGAAMAGVIVTVEFRNGSTTSGEVIADANNPNRAFVQL